MKMESGFNNLNKNMNTNFRIRSLNDAFKQSQRLPALPTMAANHHLKTQSLSKTQPLAPRAEHADGKRSNEAFAN